MDNQSRIFFVGLVSILYLFFFGTALQYLLEISGLELSRNNFYQTQLNYGFCFTVLIAISVALGQSFALRMLVVGVFVNVFAAIAYSIYHFIAVGDSSALWRATEHYSRYFLAFIAASIIAHFVAETVVSKVGLRNSNNAQPAIAPDYLPSNMRYAYEALSKRANELNRSAAVAIFGIVAVLFASALLFIFSGQIATLGNSRIDAYDEARSLQERQLRRSETMLSDLRGLSISMKSSSAQPAKEAVEQFGETTKLLNSTVDQANKIGDELRGMREKMIEAQIQGKKSIDIEFMIFSSVTRFGVLGISAYLVYILVNLYRFNVLQSVFYSSICDAILINGKIDLSNIEIIKFLRSEVTFGSMHERTLTSMLSEIRDLLQSGSGKDKAEGVDKA